MKCTRTIIIITLSIMFQFCVCHGCWIDIYLKVSSHTRLLISPFLQRAKFFVSTCVSIKMKMARPFCIHSQQTPQAIMMFTSVIAMSIMTPYVQWKILKSVVGGFMFNITKEDVDAFAVIGASFYVSNPMDLVDGGKLYFVPPKNFNATDSPFAGGETATTSYNLPPVSDRHSSSKQHGKTFVPNVEILKNGVQDFNTDIQMDGMEYEEGGDDQNEDKMYDLFTDLDLCETIPDEFQFSEDYSGDEDAFLDNNEDELKNVMPLKPQKNRNVHALKSDHIKPRARKELNEETSSSPVGIHINLTNDDTQIQPSPIKEITPASSNDIPIDLTHNQKTFHQPKNPDNILSVTVSASNPSQHHFTYDSEPLSSDNTSFLSDSSSSTSRRKPPKFEKVKIDEERMK